MVFARVRKVTHNGPRNFQVTTNTCTKTINFAIIGFTHKVFGISHANFMEKTHNIYLKNQ